MTAAIEVQVVHALPDRALVKTLRLPPGARVADALAAAGLDAEFAGIDFAAVPVGIFGRIAPRDQELAHGDRLEVYRPLAEDPKAARRARARQARRQS